LSREGFGEVRYAGQEQIERYARLITQRAGVDCDTVRFGLLGDAMCPITTGASRNALLLETAGTIALQMDDDTECVLSPAPEMYPGLAISSEEDPTQFWFFE